MTTRKHEYQLDTYVIYFDQVEYDWQPDDYQTFDGQRYLVIKDRYDAVWLDDFDVYEIDDEGNETPSDYREIADKIPEIYLQKIADEQRLQYADDY